MSLIFHRLDRVESTNETAKLPQFQTAPHGTVIIAEEQTGGKGRHGKSFHSPPDQIYMSVILQQADSPELTTIQAAVCVCKAIEALTSKTPKIKWVNDIFINGKKICGILAERNSASPDRVIVGIGINFYGVDFPPELPDAGCLFDFGEELTLTREQLITETATAIIQRPNKQDLIQQYKSRLIQGSNLDEINKQLSQI